MWSVDESSTPAADLGSPLPFADDTFDDVIASLVLHYLEDWGPPLAELRRVLRPGGRLIMSTHHPAMLHAYAEPGVSYFATYRITEEWNLGGQIAVMSFWHRPLHAMIDVFTAAGFRLSVLSEPQPAPVARELFPEGFTALSKDPCFLFFVLDAV